MRILFTFAGGSGHFEPLVPVAHAAVEAGHTVAFSCRAGMISKVERAGFTAFASGMDYGDNNERFPLLAVDFQRELDALRDWFAGRLARERAADLVTLCTAWKPDLIVCDEIDFGAMVAAERLGLPYASVLVIAAGSFVQREAVGEVLHKLREEHDLPPDPELTMLSRYLVLSPFPPSYRDPVFPLPMTAHSFRVSGVPVTGELPQWMAALNAVPTVYFTLGTVFNRESGDLFARVIEALRPLSINLIVTVGPHIDPAEFGPQPEHVHLEQYIPQALLLPYCDLVVSHGGSGSVMGALAHGLPSVLIPMGADQPLNAMRCEMLSVGRVLNAVTATPDEIRQVVSAVLEDSAYRQAAERLRDEIASLPDPSYAVTLLERLAAEKQPIIMS